MWRYKHNCLSAFCLEKFPLRNLENTTLTPPTDEERKQIPLQKNENRPPLIGNLVWSILFLFFSKEVKRKNQVRSFEGILYHLCVLVRCFLLLDLPTNNVRGSPAAQRISWATATNMQGEYLHIFVFALFRLPKYSLTDLSKDKRRWSKNTWRNNRLAWYSIIVFQITDSMVNDVWFDQFFSFSSLKKLKERIRFVHSKVSSITFVC